MSLKPVIFIFLLSFAGFCSKEKTQSPILFGFAIEGFPVTAKSLIEQSRETKVVPQLTLFYLQWSKEPGQGKLLLESFQAIWDIGSVPCLSWEPMQIKEGKEHTISYQEILNGTYDSYIDEMADAIAAWRKRVIIRFAHEMNLKRYHWGDVYQEEFDKNSPEIYKEMYRYVVDRFRKKNVTNTLWAFCPNVDSVPADGWNTPTHYYPGDNYVDILGMDGYNWNISEKLAKEEHISWSKPWQSFEQLFKPLYTELKALAPNKPIVVFETASVDREPGDKISWLKEGLAVAKKWDLSAIIWFPYNKEEDWRLNQFNDYTYKEILLDNFPSYLWLNTLQIDSQKD